MCFGGGGGGGSSNDNDNDSGSRGNSFSESLANIFTPNDGASYVGGQLVDDNTGQSISAGGTTSTGNVISGVANTTSNDNQPLPSSGTSATQGTSATKAIEATSSLEDATSEYDKVLADLVSKTNFTGSGADKNDRMSQLEYDASLISGTYDTSGLSGSEKTDISNQAASKTFEYENPEEFTRLQREAENPSGSRGALSNVQTTSGSVANSLTESFANIFTPFDGASYVNGQLVDDATGERISSGGTTSTGNVIAGTANTRSNDRITSSERTGALPATMETQPLSTDGIENSTRENLANILTPFDGASYVNGQLVDDATGASLTGGGYSSKGDYIYGVSDDASNNVLDTTGMSASEVANATAGQQMLDDIPPSDLAYFASFIPGMALPVIGGFLGEKMLEGGIEERKSIIDQQVAALEMGATPQFDSQGNYVGFDNSTTTSFADQVLGADDIRAFLPPSTAASSFNVTQTDIDQLRASGFEDRANELQVGQTLNLSAFDNPAYSADANNDGINDYDRFQTVFGVQSAAADADPYGMSTENGFITSGGVEYYIQGDGSVVPITGTSVSGTDFVPYNAALGGIDVSEVPFELPIDTPIVDVPIDIPIVDLPIVDLPIVEVDPDDPDSPFSPIRSDIYGTRTNSEDYNRRFKGGGMGNYMPEYLRRYASGESIDELVRKTTLPDGTPVYVTPDGRYLRIEDFAGTALSDKITNVKGEEEQFLQGYTLTDAAGNVTTYTSDGSIISNALGEPVDFNTS